ncbi:lysophospholipid transporter LplT [Methylotetracoccus oryzae]|uniref:lysophospholipid transporter LplT n=1 Tax=Methylotetracoccus oryzae TaxID=1919059 RepID=UPI00111A4BCC|nr:lysophospholipid transporter LplT [Methylotetracoccus oryzae]
MSDRFYTVLAAQFFSALGDNALLFAAIALLRSLDMPSWQIPALQEGFVVSFIALAPFVGPFADALPKGRVMLISNTVKIVGCGAMLVGLPPLLAYGFVGIGAAMYSPAKYGILTECLPPERLVWANGWMEGLTVAAIILGAILGGLLIGDTVQERIVSALQGQPFATGIDTAPEFAIAVVLVIYLVAALFNLYIPKVPIDHALPQRTLGFIVRDFAQSFLKLWRDPLGQVSLAVTTLFWGAGSTLRLIILLWAAEALGFNLEQATQLTAVVAVGIGIGAAIAGRSVPLDHAVRVLRVGVAMGFTVAIMALVTDWRVAIPLLALIGALGGYFVVPMNALLQHRGHLLMGAGHSIAVQNFNENLSILMMLGAYSLMIRAGWPVNLIVVAFGLTVAGAMGWLTKVHGHDQDG